VASAGDLVYLPPGVRHDGVALEYTHPQTGGSLLPTMACWIQMLRPGERTPAERRTSSGIFHVIEGRGQSRIGDANLAWEKGDTFVAPGWNAIGHRATSDAQWFAMSDEPLMRFASYYRFEAVG